MPIAAIPAYLDETFEDASPGMRFGMYLKLWGVDEQSRVPHWDTFDWIYRETGKDRQIRKRKQENKSSALTAACQLDPKTRQINEALVDRQRRTAAALPDCVAYPAMATAPFTSGLGNAHPLENGFAFLWPYGLPYLPGSGVKGVLRQSACELAKGAWGDRRGWSTEKTIRLEAGKNAVPLSLVDLFFGLESEDGKQAHFRGLLNVWDVIPHIRGDRLMVEIMTPHQADYYQGDQAPHDSGKPTPVGFLTVPPGSAFTFFVQCDRVRLARIAPELNENERWKALLQAAFEHAFEWLGFGAKTAVGYGAMHLDHQALRRHEEATARHERESREREKRAAEARAREAQLKKMDPLQRRIEEYPSVNEALKALEAGVFDEVAIAARWLRERMQREKTWRETSSKKRPEKDKPHQLTLRVMKYLEDD